MKRVTWAAAGFLLAFAILLAIRLEVPLRRSAAPVGGEPAAAQGIGESDTWMNLYLGERKVGYTHSKLTRRSGGYRLEDTLRMRMNLMGLSQEVRMQTSADLTADLSLERFDFFLQSGVSRLSGTGRLTANNVLELETGLSGTPRTHRIRLGRRPHLSGALVRRAAAEFWRSGRDRFSFELFDPAAMKPATVTLSAEGVERIPVLGQPIEVVRLLLTCRGAQQSAWVDRRGEIVREEGLLGMRLEKTTRDIATGGQPLQTAQDLTRIAAVTVAAAIAAPRRAEFLQAALSGVDPGGLALDGGRQTFSGGVLTVRREALPPPDAVGPAGFSAQPARYLAPEPFIESDHPAIVARSREIVPPGTPAVAAARAVVDWVFENIRKQPLISVPDALATLESGVGDCNEHAVLVAALARAAGIPTTIETGLVYLDGRFFYHAWNAFYLGGWVTADAVFGQLPADATHIRLTRGGPGAALDLLAVIDRIGIRVIDYRTADDKEPPPR